MVTAMSRLGKVEMESEYKAILLAGILTAVAALIVLLSGPVRQELLPEPEAVWLAVQPADAPLAVVGPVEIAAETSFTLHAVLEARTWKGETVYYTEADGLLLHGEQIAEDRLRRWDRPEEVRNLWFTVEGYTPYLETDTAGFDSFHWKEFYRSEWANSWSVPGSVVSAADPRAQRYGEGERLRFGTQRFRLRLEIFGPESRITPRHRFSSLGADRLPDDAANFPSVVVSLPAPLDLVSRAFGLSQIEPAGHLDASSARLLADWYERDLVFSRLLLFRKMVERLDSSWDRLAWRDVDLQAGPPWAQEGVGRGDLLQVGERIVVLYRDRGDSGILDGEDLCFDFHKGPAVRPLAEIFTGDGLIQWSPLSSLTSRSAAAGGNLQ